MSERWPRFGFKQQPAVEVEAASPPPSNGAEPEQAGNETIAQTAVPEGAVATAVAPATASGEDAAVKPWETPEAAEAAASASASSEASAPEAAAAEAAAAEESASAEAEAAEEAASEAAAPEVTVTPVAIDEGSKFLAELVRAMQATAKDERARIDEDVERRRNDSVEQVRARQASEADRMRELADADRKSIEAWAEGETKRIQLEREKRETELNKDLEVSLANHGASIDRQIEALEAAISTYRGEVAAFFEALDRETDPVLIAQRASQRPVVPDLDAIAQAPVPAEPAMVGVMGATESPARLGSWAAPPPAPAEGAEPVAIGASPEQRSGSSLLETVPAERPMSWLRRARTVGENDTNQEG